MNYNSNNNKSNTQEGVILIYYSHITNTISKLLWVGLRPCDVRTTSRQQLWREAAHHTASILPTVAWRLLLWECYSMMMGGKRVKRNGGRDGMYLWLIIQSWNTLSREIATTLQINFEFKWVGIYKVQTLNQAIAGHRSLKPWKSCLIKIFSCWWNTTSWKSWSQIKGYHELVE